MWVRRQRWEWCGHKPRKPRNIDSHQKLEEAMKGLVYSLQREWSSHCLDLHLLLSKTVREHISSLATQIVAICYGSHRKLIYLWSHFCSGHVLKVRGKENSLFFGVTKSVQRCSELPVPLHRQIVPEDEINPGKYSQEAEKRVVPKDMIEKPGSNCAWRQFYPCRFELHESKNPKK